MFFSIATFILCVIFGWILGIFSGLVPGIHVNNISVILVASSAIFYEFQIDTVHIASIILSCAISHTFHDILPTIFLGAPGSDTALAVLPGHRLLMAGLGPFAVRISALSSIGSVIFSTIFIIPLGLFFYFFYDFVSSYMGLILLTAAILLIISADGLFDKIKTLFVFIISGILGFYSFYIDGNFLSLGENASILMPILSGLFGASQLILSIMKYSEIPDSLLFSEKPSYKSLIKNSFIGSMSGAIVAWIPGISSSIATVYSIFIPESIVKFASFLGIVKKEPEFKFNSYMNMSYDSAKDYIMRISSINTSNAIFGLVAFFLINKSRNGAVIAINKLFLNAPEKISVINMDFLSLISLFLIFYIAIIICSFLSFFSTIEIGNKMTYFIQKINYQLFSILTLIFLSSLILIFTGISGLIIFFISILIGFLPIILNVRKSSLMGVILIPVMFYFL
ncbi:MAG: hypothetical protein GX362_02385 [Methanosarcinaceae archaeon]|mgnify:CR=1 FL=1|nr:hypothetical protein [Methanosarcinaceae archaeon]